MKWNIKYKRIKYKKLKIKYKKLKNICIKNPIPYIAPFGLVSVLIYLVGILSEEKTAAEFRKNYKAILFFLVRIFSRFCQNSWSRRLRLQVVDQKLTNNFYINSWSLLYIFIIYNHRYVLTYVSWFCTNIPYFD